MMKTLITFVLGFIIGCYVGIDLSKEEVQQKVKDVIEEYE